MIESYKIPYLRYFAEGVAIVISILLAFAVQAWWDERSDSSREQLTLTSLDQELSDNKQALLGFVEDLEAQRLVTLHYLETIVTGAPENITSGSILEMVWRLGPYRMERLGRAALAEALASGAYGLIKSADLRQSLTEYDQAMTRDFDSQEAVLRFWDTEMGPYEREHADLFSMIPDDWWSAIQQPRPDVSWEINKSAFVENRLYSNYLGLRLLRENEVISRHRDVIALIDKVQNLISINLEP